MGVFPLVGKDVFFPLPLDDVVRSLVPAPADDQVGAAVAVEVGHSQALAGWALHGPMDPGVRTLLYPNLQLTPIVGSEGGLAPGHNVEFPIAVQVGQLDVVGFWFSDDVQLPFPHTLAGIFEPDDPLGPEPVGNDNVLVTIPIDVADRQTTTPASLARRNDVLGPLRVLIPHNGTLGAGDHQIGESIAIDIPDGLALDVRRPVIIDDHMLKWEFVA